jgi:cytochrome c-type biogenesis protein CcmH
MPPPALAARILVLAIAAVAGSIAGPGAAATPADDPRIEARARAIGKELRCLVCQNQSIDDSDAELAQDLRRLVRERVAAGDSDQAVIAYVVSRYGDFVRLKPPFKPATYALWLGPAAIAALATLVVIAYFRRRPVEDDAMLAPGEEEQLARLLQAGRDADRKT